MLQCAVMIGHFFFKQKTAYEVRISDWSSDVCSSDLGMRRAGRLAAATLDFIAPHVRPGISTAELDPLCEDFMRAGGGVPAPIGYKGYAHASRSEAPSVGKEYVRKCISRWSAVHYKNTLTISLQCQSTHKYKCN